MMFATMFPRTFLSDNDVTAINATFADNQSQYKRGSHKWGRRTDSFKMSDAAEPQAMVAPVWMPSKDVADNEVLTLTQGESKTVTIPQSGMLYINIKSSKPMHVHRPSAPTVHAWNQVIRVRGTSLLALNYQHETLAKNIADAWEYRVDEMTMIVSSQVITGQLTFDVSPWNFDELTIDSTFTFDVQTLGEEEQPTVPEEPEGYDFGAYTSGWEWAFASVGYAHQSRMPMKVCVESKPMLADSNVPLTIQLPSDGNRMYHVVLLPLEGDGKFGRPSKVKTEAKHSFIPMPAARCLFKVQDVFGGIAFNCADKHKALTLMFTNPTKFVLSIYSSPQEEPAVALARMDATFPYTN
jgi:hypothetical protein